MSIIDEAKDVIPFPVLTKEVGRWSLNNFGSLQNPWLGMVEEVGELAHCLLKRTQRIRGFDDPAFFLEQFKDALGDIGIYAANYAYNEKFYHVQYPKAKPELTMDKHIANTIFWLSELMLVGETEEDYRVWFRNLLKEVSCVAILEGLDLQEVITDTWLRVKMRNWKENSLDGQTTAATHEENVVVDAEEKESNK